MRDISKYIYSQIKKLWIYKLLLQSVFTVMRYIASIKEEITKLIKAHKWDLKYLCTWSLTTVKLHTKYIYLKTIFVSIFETVQTCTLASLWNYSAWWQYYNPVMYLFSVKQFKACFCVLSLQRCRVCTDCGARGLTLPGSEQWFESYSVCESCQRQRMSVCGVCSKVTESSITLQHRCSICHRWVCTSILPS